MDLSSVVLSFATGTYIVTRPPRASFNSTGDPSIGSATTLQVQACVQPATGRDLKRLPEGLDATEVMAVFSLTELKAGQEPDTISIDGVTYQVQTAERWGSLGNYWKALVARV